MARAAYGGAGAQADDQEEQVLIHGAFVEGGARPATSRKSSVSALTDPSSCTSKKSSRAAHAELPAMTV